MDWAMSTKSITWDIGNIKYIEWDFTIAVLRIGHLRHIS